MRILDLSHNTIGGAFDALTSKPKYPRLLYLNLYRTSLTSGDIQTIDSLVKENKIPQLYYRSGTVNSNMVNSKLLCYCEIFFYQFPNIPYLKYTVNSNFHLIRTLLTNDFELTVPDLYLYLNNINLDNVELDTLETLETLSSILHNLEHVRFYKEDRRQDSRKNTRTRHKTNVKIQIEEYQVIVLECVTEK